MDPLTITKAELGRGARISLTVLPGNAEVVARLADDMLAEYQAALAAGRPQAVFIVPVGPVGQYDMLADRCNAERISLRRLVLINMDEYLTADGLDWIPAGDPLAFRRHMDEHFYARLDPALALRRSSACGQIRAISTVSGVRSPAGAASTSASAASASPATWLSTILRSPAST